MSLIELFDENPARAVFILSCAFIILDICFIGVCPFLLNLCNGTADCKKGNTINSNRYQLLPETDGARDDGSELITIAIITHGGL